ncbi:MAG TPA: hypothetical protein VMO26_02525 [Vicinamibacterales bacterium]|nr:hypothetical protein [Vicinamibacterales bacterium]
MTVVVRGEAVALPVAAIVTDPLPLPLLPLVMLSQEDDSDAAQAQPLVVVTVTLALPPPAASEGGFVGETAKLHGAVKMNVSGATMLLARPPGPTAAIKAV